MRGRIVSSSTQTLPLGHHNPLLSSSLLFSQSDHLFSGVVWVGCQRLVNSPNRYRLLRNFSTEIIGFSHVLKQKTPPPAFTRAFHALFVFICLCFPCGARNRQRIVKSVHFSTREIDSACISPSGRRDSTDMGESGWRERGLLRDEVQLNQTNVFRRPCSTTFFVDFENRKIHSYPSLGL